MPRNLVLDMRQGMNGGRHPKRVRHQNDRLGCRICGLDQFPTQSSRTGFDHSACCTRRAVESLLSQRVCQ